jgi:hypothetical protein
LALAGESALLGLRRSIYFHSLKDCKTLEKRGKIEIKKRSKMKKKSACLSKRLRWVYAALSISSHSNIARDWRKGKKRKEKKKKEKRLR